MIAKSFQSFILIYMNNLFRNFFSPLKQKKVYCTILIFGTILAIILGVIAAINFGDGIFTINLDHIAYIRFLKDECGFMSMFLGLFLSLFVFFMIVFFCHWKSFLVPIGVLFYFYLVYSQAVIFVSIILIYGILNCVILAVLMLIYCLLIWVVFMVILAQLLCHTNSIQYFKNCSSAKESNILISLIILTLITFIFSLILLILKNYIILLIF